MRSGLVAARTVQAGDRLPSHPGRVVKRVEAAAGETVLIVFDNGETHVQHMDAPVRIVTREGIRRDAT